MTSTAATAATNTTSPKTRAKAIGKKEIRRGRKTLESVVAAISDLSDRIEATQRSISGTREQISELKRMIEECWN